MLPQAFPYIVSVPRISLTILQTLEEVGIKSQLLPAEAGSLAGGAAEALRGATEPHTGNRPLRTLSPRGRGQGEGGGTVMFDTKNLERIA